MAYRVLADAVMVALLLAVVGAAMGPRWESVPLTDPLVPEVVDTAIGGADGPAAAVPRYPVRTTEVTLEVDGVAVVAALREPVGAAGPLPGVVFLHGAGTGSHLDAFVAQAEALAAAGTVTLVPDKRLDTYSLRHRDYLTMAADYAVSVAWLRAHAQVDPQRVGIYAESEGAWIAPVIAAADPEVAFVVLASAPVVPPRQQAAFATGSYLRNTGVPEQVFRAIPRAVGMQLPGGGFEYADFDVAPYQRRMTQPVLVAYGTADASMPMVQGTEQILRDLAIAGNSQVTVRFYDGADHGLKVDGAVTPDFLRDLATWVVGLPATASAAPRIAGAAPVQDYWALPVPQPGWLGNGDVLVALVAACAGLVGLPMLAWGAAAGVRRARRASGTLDGHDVRRGEATAAEAPVPARRAPSRVDRGEPGIDPGLAGPLALLGNATLLTVAGLVWYLLAVARLALGYERNAWVVQGGWLGVRLLGMVAVLGGALALHRVRERRRDGLVLLRGRAAVAGVACAVVGSVALLVVLAYWGVFQLGI